MDTTQTTEQVGRRQAVAARIVEALEACGAGVAGRVWEAGGRVRVYIRDTRQARDVGHLWIASDGDAIGRVSVTGSRDGTMQRAIAGAVAAMGAGWYSQSDTPEPSERHQAAPLTPGSYGQCRDCGAPGSRDGRALGISCGCAGER